MKRQTKKLVLPLLLSGVLIGSNVCYVCAQADVTSGMEAPTGENLPGGGITAEQSVQLETPVQTTQPETPAQTTQPDTPVQTETTVQPESGAQVEETAQPDGSTEDGSGERETEAVVPGDGNDVEAGEGTETDAADGEGLPDDVAAATGTEETPEQAFVNGSGETVIPSTLVGVDYNTVSEIYDGATNVLKQYVVSDTYDKDTVIECFVDENGNLVMVISQGVPESEAAEEDLGFLQTVESKLASVFGESNSAPAVDGSFTGWDDVPSSYEFNWNKPDAWVDGVHYTETNSTDVRHEMQIYSDGENVYLRVVFAREFCNGQVANGNDYQFWIDDMQMAAYQVEWPDGTSLSNSNAEPGVYQVDVRHRDSSWSYVLTDGAVAYYRVNDGNLNNELELKIPLSEFVKQNENINLDNYSMISFFTPNLMQNKISTGGASTGAEPFAAAVFLLVPTSYVYIKKKDKKEMAFA